MFDKMTELKIYEAISMEYANACKTYGKEYHSAHEAYAVLLEEIEEAEQNLDYIRNHLSMMWDDVKTDNNTDIKNNARVIGYDAVELAKESVQIAAVARKIMGV